MKIDAFFLFLSYIGSYLSWIILLKFWNTTYKLVKWAYLGVILVLVGSMSLAVIANFSFTQQTQLGNLSASALTNLQTRALNIVRTQATPDCRLGVGQALLGDDCDILLDFRDQIQADLDLTDAEFSAYFTLTAESGLPGWELADRAELSSLLTEKSAEFEASAEEPEFFDRGDYFAVIGEYPEVYQLDTQSTMANLRDFNSIKYLAQVDNPLEITTTAAVPSTHENKPVKHYPQLISTGYARLESWHYSRVRNLKKGLDSLDGSVIPANSEFSFIEASDAKLYRNSGSGYFPVGGGDQAYGYGICGASTAIYRAALNAGLPFTEHHTHSKAWTNYLHPYETMVDATVFFDVNYTLDLKFQNDSEGEIYVDTYYEVGADGWLNYYVDFYADENFTMREVELGDFSRQNRGSSYLESFTRTVDGETETKTASYRKIY